MKNKILVLASCLILFLTGCSSKKEENKEDKGNKENKKEQVVVNKENNDVKEKEVSYQSSNKQEEKTVFKHNKEEAKKLVNDVISFQVNSFDIKKMQYERTIPSGFATLPTLSNNVRTINTDNLGVINVIKLQEIVDTYNTYNKNTYNETAVLEDIRELFTKNKLISYTEVSEKSSNLTDADLKKKFEKMDTVIYFKGDKTFGYNIPFGLGGAGFPQASPESSWIEDEDELEIPIINVQDNKVVNIVTLKINNKNYTGGAEKSYYYYDDID